MPNGVGQSAYNAEQAELKWLFGLIAEDAVSNRQVQTFFDIEIN